MVFLVLLCILEHFHIGLLSQNELCTALGSIYLMFICRRKNAWNRRFLKIFPALKPAHHEELSNSKLNASSLRHSLILSSFGRWE